MTDSDRAPTPPRGILDAAVRDQSSPTDAGFDPEQVLEEIARLANVLCEHLADDHFTAAAKIRHLAETTRLCPGDS
ncbi:hypothetical protein [Streptomyces sp. NPDC002851]